MSKDLLRNTCLLINCEESYCRKFFPVKSILHYLFLPGIFFLLAISSFAQEPSIEASIDTAQIKIGDQVLYKITVETNASNLVVFPEGESFNPMEVVESLAADTSRLEDRFRLVKEYSLTQFDSGSYTIPQQRVLINETPYFTDSLRVMVADVVVDTTKQKMYA